MKIASHIENDELVEVEIIVVADVPVVEVKAVVEPVPGDPLGVVTKCIATYAISYWQCDDPSLNQ